MENRRAIITTIIELRIMFVVILLFLVAFSLFIDFLESFRMMVMIVRFEAKMTNQATEVVSMSIVNSKRGIVDPGCVNFRCVSQVRGIEKISGNFNSSSVVD